MTWTFRDPSPRWQHRSLLNSPSSHGHTESTATHRRNISEINPETSWGTLTHWVSEKIPTSKQVLVHPQLLGATKNKEADLYNHKGLRGNQEAG